MAEISFPVAGGAGVIEATYERLMGPLLGSGRVAFLPTSGQLETPLIFADNSGRQVKAYANQAAILRGFRWESGSTPPVLALDANTSGNPRIDLIVLRLNRTTWTVRLGKTNGTPAAVPNAPAAIQDTGSDGVWELPVATVRVVSSGTNGQPFIQAIDVVAKDWWLAPPAIVTASDQMPPASHGQVVHQYDTGKTFRAIGSSYVLQGEAGAWTKLTSAGGWTGDELYGQRVNGLTYFQAHSTLNVTSRQPNTDMLVCTLPATFRPLHDLNFSVLMSPSQMGAGNIDAATGKVSITTYPDLFPNGGRITIGPLTWPNI